MWKDHKFGIGIILLVLGVVFLFAGIFTQHYLPHLLTNEIQSSLIITSQNDKGYEKWRTNTHPDDVPLYQFFYMFNLTNKHEVILNGSIPQYSQCGPYVFRKDRTKLDATYLENGNQVQYKLFTQYHFEANMSQPYTMADKITNMNPTYMALLQRVGSEHALLPLATSGMLNNMMFFYTTTFVDAYIQNQAAVFLQNIVDNFVASGVSLQQFCSNWANATTLPDKSWSGLLISEGKTASKIPLNICMNLLSNTTAYSLTHTAFKSSNTWVNASYGEQKALQLLKSTFNIDDEKLNYILDWLATASFRVERVSNIILQKFAPYGVKKLADLGYLQWGDSTVLGHFVSMVEMFPDHLYGGKYNNAYSEYAVFARRVLPKMPLGWSLNYTQAQSLLNGPYGLIKDPVNFLNFTQAVTKFEENVLLKNWGITKLHGLRMLAYLVYVSMTFCPEIIGNIVANDGGVFTTKSVDEWLWVGHDPLLNFYYPDARSNMFTNYTDETQARSKETFNIQYTGKNDINSINNYAQWHEKSSIDVWKESEPINGTDGYGFQPSINQNTNLSVWMEDILRKIDIYYTETKTLYGINLQRYVPVPATFNINDKYYQYIAGFANLTNVKNSPIYVSKPHFLDIPGDWITKVSGLNPIRDNHDTYLDVEPLTGVVMDAKKRLQLNIYITPNPAQFDVFSITNRFPKNTSYPILWVQEGSAITEDLAAKFKAKIDSFNQIKTSVFLSGTILGSFALLGGVVFIVWSTKKSVTVPKPEYSKLSQHIDDAEGTLEDEDSPTQKNSIN